MSDWRITYEGQTKEPSEWGIRGLKLEYISQGQDMLTFVADGLAIEKPEIFAYGKELSLEYAGGCVFRGIVIETPASGTASAENHSYTVAGPWWYLDNLVYQLQWKLWKFQSGVWSSSDQYTSHLILGLDYYGANISTGAQIIDAVNYAAAQGAKLQVYPFILPDRATDPKRLYPPPDEVRDLTCAEAIKKMLRWHPDAVTYFDYGYEPPMLHVKRREDMKAVDLAINPAFHRHGTPPPIDPQFKIASMNIQPRYDLTRDVVCINYISRGSRNNQETQDLVTELYPLSATGREIGALVLTFDLQGARISTLSAAVEAEPTDFTALQTWLDRIPLLSDARVDPASIVGPYEITQNGSLGLPRELIGGQVGEWMIEDGAPVLAEDVIWAAKFDFKVFETAGLTAGTELKYPVEKVFTIRTKMTNARTGTYSTIESFDAGDSVPIGIAEFLQRSLGPLMFEGEVELIEEEALAAQPPGTSVTQNAVNISKLLNLVGGPVAWADMKALVQRISIDLDNGVTRAQFGPPGHLSAGDIVDLLKVGRQRFRFTNPLTRSTGEMPGSELKLGTDVEGIDTNEGAELYRQFKVKDARPATGPQSVFIDGVAGKITATAGNPNIPGQPNAQKTIDLNFKQGQIKVTDESSHATAAQQKQIDLSITDCKSTTASVDTNRPVKVREYKLCIDQGTGEKKYRVLLAGSEPYPLEDNTTPDCAGGGSVNFRGEWVSKPANDPNPYKKGDIVKVSVGVVAGTYIATATPTAGELPYLGVNYSLIGRTVDQSNWI